MELRGTFPAPGLDAHPPGRTGQPQVALSVVAATELIARQAEPRVLTELPLPRGSFTISTAGDGGYWLDHAYYGSFHVSADGAQVACAPSDLPAWLWQRFLIAQPLPLASLLYGYEPLHASAVAVGGEAWLLMGTSGAGKSSVALQLAARGASFLADDVTALELKEGGISAHPGPPISSVDTDELETLSQAGMPRWRSLGSLEGESRIVIVDASPEAQPVGAVYVLTRTTEARAIEIGPPISGRAKALLGGTFNAFLRTPARLKRQLELSACLAETATVLQVRIPMDADAGTAADAILRKGASGSAPRPR